MTIHNPIQEIQQLQSILSSPSKKIGFLFGAGISIKDLDGNNLISGVEKMTKDVVAKFTNEPQKTAIELMKTEIESEPNKKFNIETLLSKISEKERAAGSEKLCDLTKQELQILREHIEEEIRELVSVHEKNGIKCIRNTNHDTFSKWISSADRDYPVEIFTTNYDYLLELALEKQQIPYFDGFVGSYKAFFCPEWIEDDAPVKDWVKLWKLHGSLGWDKNDKNEIIRTSGASGKAMIYPSFLKYDHSKKQPYLSYMDQLSKFLKKEDSVLFVCGYSFGDEHINEIIKTSLLRPRSSSVFILKNGELKKDDTLIKDVFKGNSKISIYAQRTAIISGEFGEWKLDREPDENESEYILEYFFDTDAATPKEKKGLAYNFTGLGNCRLGDFKFFTKFLNIMDYNSKKNEK